MSRVVLDSEAFNALAGPASEAGREMARIVAAAQRAEAEVVVPAVVLAELYRPGRLAAVDSCLARSNGAPACRDTDRSLARTVGGVLAAAGAGSEMMVDAHVVATAVEGGRSMIVTGDPVDIERLAAPYQSVTVVHLP